MDLTEVKFIDLAAAPEMTIKKMADLYCAIWKEPPWNEYFWTVEGVLEDIGEQMKIPLAKGFIATYKRGPWGCEVWGIDVPEHIMNDDHVEPIGFTFGYEVTASDLQRISGVADDIWEQIIGTKRTFYIDELAVYERHRRLGIGEELTRKLLSCMPNFGVRCVTLRTDVRADAARHLYRKVGFEELPIIDAEYPDRTYWLLLI